jgi:glycerophosphoryl diester phosphodiesterase
MPFNGFTQSAFAQKLIDEYKTRGVGADHVWAQSFLLDDLDYWIKAEPAFGRQAVYLDGRYDIPIGDLTPTMAELAAKGINIIAPPQYALLDVDAEGDFVASAYAKETTAAGLGIIAWTLERSGPLSTGGGWYWTGIEEVAKMGDGSIFSMLHALDKKVGVMGVFSDWPATVTYYANCMM